LPLLWLSYALFVVYVTTLPFGFDPSVDHAMSRLAAMSRNPFLSQDGGRASFSDMLQNVVLFSPFGALTALVLRQRRRTASRPVPLFSAAAGFCLSAGVETLQLFTIDRTPSLNDVLTNTAGALGGGIAVVVATWAAERTRSVPHAADVLYRCYPLLLWGGVAALAAWHPFDTTVDVSSVAGKVRTLLTDPWQAGPIGDEGVDAVRYALVAVSAAIVWKRWRLRYATVVAILATSLLGVALEMSQFFVLSRMPSVKDAAVAAAGGLVGAVSCRLLWQRPSSAPAIVRPALVAPALVTIAATWLAAGLMLLKPLTFSSTQQAIQYTPFLDYMRPSPESMVSHVVELTLAFFPIGFALGMIVRRPRLWVATGLVAGLLAVVLEYGQSWVIGRYADVTDAGVLVLGAFAGAWASLPARAPAPVEHPTG
jgi:VanZ family protein